MKHDLTDVSKDPRILKAAKALAKTEAELAETRGRLSAAKAQRKRLADSWVKSKDKDRPSIEQEQMVAELAVGNLGRLIEHLQGQVAKRQDALREADSKARREATLQTLEDARQAANVIREATRALLEAHISYQEAKARFETERGALKRACGGDLPGDWTEIRQGPKLAMQLRQDLKVYDQAAKRLASLEGAGCLEPDGDQRALDLWARAHSNLQDVGPGVPSFLRTRVFKGKGG